MKNLQKNNFILILILISSISCAAEQQVNTDPSVVSQEINQEYSLLRRAQNAYKKLIHGLENSLNAMGDNIAISQIENFFGSSNVSQENETCIRNILKKIGVKNSESVRIKSLSKQAKFAGMGPKNACAVALLGVPAYIFVSEDWFNTLTDAKKEFLIAHEAMHLIYNHQIKSTLLRTAFAFGIPASSMFLNYWLIKKKYFGIFDGVSLKMQVIWQTIILTDFNFLELILANKSLHEYSRSCEYQADAQAALALGTYEGAQELLEEFEELQNEWDAELPQRDDLKLARKLARQNADHPSNYARLEYIKSVLKNHKDEQDTQQQNT